MWLSFYRSSFLQKESSKKVVITLEDSDLKERFLSAYLPTPPLSQQFVPTWGFSVNVGFGRRGKVGIVPYLRYLGSNATPKLSSVKYAIPGSPRYQENRLNLLYSCSLHNRWYFFVKARRARHMRLWKALLARFALAFVRLKNAKK